MTTSKLFRYLRVSKLNIEEMTKSLDRGSERYNELIDNIDRLVETVDDYVDFLKETLADADNGIEIDSWYERQLGWYERQLNTEVEEINNCRYDDRYSFFDFEENFDDSDFIDVHLGIEGVDEKEDDNEYVYGWDIDELSNKVYDLVQELRTVNSDWWEGSYGALVNKVRTTKNEYFDIDLEDDVISVDLRWDLIDLVNEVKKLIK